MRNQRVPDAVGRSFGRAGVLAAVLLVLSLAGGPGAHADDGVLLDEAAGIVGEVGEQVVEPVVQTVGSTAQQPVREVVEPVQQAVEPAVADAEQSVEATVRVVEQATEPVVRVVRPAAPRAAEPKEAPAPAPAPAPVPAPALAPPRAPAVGGAGTDQPGDLSDSDQPADVGAGPRASGHDRRRADAADGSGLADLAPRAVARPAILLQDPEVDQHVVDEELRSLITALMQMWAGDGSPGAVDAGLAGRATPDAQVLGPTSGMVPVALGLLLGILSLSIRRVLVRQSGDRPRRAVATED